MDDAIDALEHAADQYDDRLGLVDALLGRIEDSVSRLEARAHRDAARPTPVA